MASPSPPAPGARFPKVDVHSHFLPDFYRDALIAAGHSHPDGMPAIPKWSLPAHRALMNHTNTTHSILSISSPSTSLYLSGPETATLASHCNDAASSISALHPREFSFWATLPLPFINESLAEIARVASMPGRVGFVLMTSYPGDLFLGDAELAPVWERLDGMGATVFIHPTSPVPGPSGCFCTRGPSSSDVRRQTLSRYPAPMMEFFFDSARTISDLILQRVPQRFPNVRFVVSHAGGALPPLLSRIGLFSQLGILENVEQPVVDEEEMRNVLAERFYFDLAGAVLPGQIKGLVEGVGIKAERLVYGSDFPFTGNGPVKMLAEKLETEWPTGDGYGEIGAVLANGKVFLPVDKTT